MSHVCFLSLAFEMQVTMQPRSCENELRVIWTFVGTNIWITVNEHLFKSWLIVAVTWGLVSTLISYSGRFRVLFFSTVGDYISILVYSVVEQISWALIYRNIKFVISVCDIPKLQSYGFWLCLFFFGNISSNVCLYALSLDFAFPTERVTLYILSYNVFLSHMCSIKSLRSSKCRSYRLCYIPAPVCLLKTGRPASHR